MKIKNQFKMLVFVFIAIVLGALFLEIASFVISKVVGLPVYKPKNIANNLFHPYLGWEYRPHAKIFTDEQNTFILIDGQGHSATPVSIENPKIRIVMTGGSTMFGVGASSNENTVPALVEKKLNNRFNGGVDVINLAGRGYQSFQEMMVCYSYMRDNRVDVVISISGRNDAYYFAKQPRMRSAFLPDYVFQITDFVRNFEDGKVMILGLSNSRLRYLNIFNLFYHVYSGHKVKREEANELECQYDCTEATDSHVTLSHRVHITKTNFEILNCISEQNNAIFVMMLQPVLFTKEMLSSVERGIMAKARTNSDYKETIKKQFYREFDVAHKNFAYFDLRNVFDEVEETVYADICHYNDRGAEFLAEVVCANVIPLIERKYQIY